MFNNVPPGQKSDVAGVLQLHFTLSYLVRLALQWAREKPISYTVQESESQPTSKWLSESFCDLYVHLSYN